MFSLRNLQQQTKNTNLISFFLMEIISSLYLIGWGIRAKQKSEIEKGKLVPQNEESCGQTVAITLLPTTWMEQTGCRTTPPGCAARHYLRPSTFMCTRYVPCPVGFICTYLTAARNTSLSARSLYYKYSYIYLWFLSIMCSSSRKIRLNNSAKEHGVRGGAVVEVIILNSATFKQYKTNSTLYDETGNFSFDDRELEDIIRY